VGQARLRDRLVPLRDLFRMSREEFYSGDVGTHYAQAWSFIYFLVSYSSRDKVLEKRVKNFYRDYFWELHKGTDPAEAADIVFKEVKFDTLEEAWIEAIPNQR
jgi:hypothetical protein